MAFLTMRSKPQLVAASGRRFGLFKRAPGLKTSEPLRPVAPSFFQILSIVAWRPRSPSEELGGAALVMTSSLNTKGACARKAAGLF
jgi:hypothetical protein